MVHVIISQHGDELIAHVMPTQKELPKFAEGNLISSFNVSQIFLNL